MDNVILQAMENGHPITAQTDQAFLYELQKAVLLALLEDGTLTELQYHSAEEALRKQCF